MKMVDYSKLLKIVNLTFKFLVLHGFDIILYSTLTTFSNQCIVTLTFDLEKYVNGQKGSKMF